MKNRVVIFTGGSGLLGSEFKKIAPDLLYPPQEEFDATNYPQMEAFVEKHGCDQIIHAAAFTSPPLIDKDPLKAIEVNIVGTANVVKLCIKHGARLMYICTDYVFQGDKGGYSENDPVHPVNKYAWSKLGGECAARMYDKALIVRTTTRPLSINGRAASRSPSSPASWPPWRRRTPSAWSTWAETAARSCNTRAAWIPPETLPSSPSKTFPSKSRWTPRSIANAITASSSTKLTT